MATSQLSRAHLGTNLGTIASKECPQMPGNSAEMTVSESGGKAGLSALERARRISVAPMLDYTDRYCRYFLRLLSPHTLLYTEMLTAAALVRGDGARLLT